MIACFLQNSNLLGFFFCNNANGISNDKNEINANVQPISGEIAILSNGMDAMSNNVPPNES